MNSICPDENVEVRHFMNDENQITIGINKDLWLIIQNLANAKSKQQDWLSGKASDSDNLNILVVSRLATRPKSVEAWQWIADMAYTTEK